MPSKSAVKKPAKKKAVVKKAAAYSCRVCGSYAVIDPSCGCGEEHILICCGRPMKKGVAKKQAAKKTATKKKKAGK